METLAAINRWLAKQHVVTWCVHHEGELWCANAFYYYDPERVAFYVLSEDKTRHRQKGPRTEPAVQILARESHVRRTAGVR
jgi:uncharacterized protein YhbP (UPF0306 family)